MQGGLSLDFNNGQNVFLDTRTLKNEATATVTDNNYTLYVSDGAVIDNVAGATWDFQNDASIQQQGGALGTFENAGTSKRPREPTIPLSRSPSIIRDGRCAERLPGVCCRRHW